MLVTADGACLLPRALPGRTGTQFSDRDDPGLRCSPRPQQIQRASPEFGRMEETASKSWVHQQFGMIAGIPKAGQVNALSTINIRGERSVTCWGDYDRHPDDGPLPAGAPPVCEIFRRQPDALERARELDAEYGADPDLETLPMYGVVSLSRILSTPVTCAPQAALMQTTISIFRPEITSWSTNCAGKVQSFTQRR